MFQEEELNEEDIQENHYYGQASVQPMNQFMEIQNDINQIQTNFTYLEYASQNQAQSIPSYIGHDSFHNQQYNEDIFYPTANTTYGISDLFEFSEFINVINPQVHNTNSSQVHNTYSSQVHNTFQSDQSYNNDMQYASINTSNLFDSKDEPTTTTNHSEFQDEESLTKNVNAKQSRVSNQNKFPNLANHVNYRIKEFTEYGNNVINQPLIRSLLTWQVAKKDFQKLFNFHTKESLRCEYKGNYTHEELFSNKTSKKLFIMYLSRITYDFEKDQYRKYKKEIKEISGEQIKIICKDGSELSEYLNNQLLAFNQIGQYHQLMLKKLINQDDFYYPLQNKNSQKLKLPKQQFNLQHGKDLLEFIEKENN